MATNEETSDSSCGKTNGQQCGRHHLMKARRYTPWYSTAHSVEDEIRNGHRNAKRNPNRNQETTILRLFSNFQMERDLEQQFHDSD